MEAAIPEKDWKYLRSVQADMLSCLCERMNRRAIEIIGSAEESECNKYRKLYKHMFDSDEIIARCFNDWRRSNIRLKLFMLHSQGLLTEENIKHLSDETKKRLTNIEQLSDQNVIQQGRRINLLADSTIIFGNSSKSSLKTFLLCYRPHIFQAHSWPS